MVAKTGQFLNQGEAFANLLEDRDAGLWPNRNSGRIESTWEDDLPHVNGDFVRRIVEIFEELRGDMSHGAAFFH